MKNGLVIFLGVFATLALSWAGALLAAHKQIGALPQFKDPVEQTINPAPLTGIADTLREQIEEGDRSVLEELTEELKGKGSDHTPAESTSREGRLPPKPASPAPEPEEEDD